MAGNARQIRIGDLSGASTGICTGKLPWEYSQGSGVNLLVRDVDGNPIA